MRSVTRVAGMMVTALFLLVGVLGALASQPAAALPTWADEAVSGVGGFVNDGAAVNAAGVEASAPALAVRPVDGTPWVASEQAGQIIVAQYISVTGQWQQRGGALNVPASGGAHPALAWDAVDDRVWSVWSEQVAGQRAILAAYFEHKPAVALGRLGRSERGRPPGRGEPGDCFTNRPRRL